MINDEGISFSISSTCEEFKNLHRRALNLEIGCEMDF